MFCVFRVKMWKFRFFARKYGFFSSFRVKMRKLRFLVRKYAILFPFFRVKMRKLCFFCLGIWIFSRFFMLSWFNFVIQSLCQVRGAMYILPLGKIGLKVS